MLTETQAKAILELRLHRLTSLEREDIKKDLEKLVSEIKDYLEILNSRNKLLDVIKGELNEIKNEFSTPRRSAIFDKEYVSNGYYYTYDDDWSVPGQLTTIEGAGYYPQATRNF